MIKIVDNRKEASKYLKTMEDMLKKYHLAGTFREELEELFREGDFLKLYENSPVKRVLYLKNILSGVKICDLSPELGYSPSRLYEIRREILRELVMVFFKVIIL